MVLKWKIRFVALLIFFSMSFFKSSFNNIMGENNSCFALNLSLGWSITCRYTRPADSLRRTQLWALFWVWAGAVALLVEGMMVCRRDLKTWPEAELEQYFKVKVCYVISITSNKKIAGKNLDADPFGEEVHSCGVFTLEQSQETASFQFQSIWTLKIRLR